MDIATSATLVREIAAVSEMSLFVMELARLSFEYAIAAELLTSALTTTPELIAVTPEDEMVTSPVTVVAVGTPEELWTTT